MGLCSFFRRFVEKFAQRAEPLSRLTKKDIEFNWNQEQNDAFADLRNALSTSPILKLYDPQARTELHTDASAEGLAGILLQENKDGRLCMVYSVSKKTTEAEKRYHSTKLELMAIVWSIDRLRPYLLGIKFTIVTDCKALVYLNAKKTLKPQIARWFDLVQEYDYEVRHRPGDKMMHVDALSRAPVDPQGDTMEQVIGDRFDVFLTMTLEDQVLTMQRNDPDLRDVIRILETAPTDRTKEEANRVQQFELRNGRLIRVEKQGQEQVRLYVLPKTMRKGITVKCHDLSGHFGLFRRKKDKPA